MKNLIKKSLLSLLLVLAVVLSAAGCEYAYVDEFSLDESSEVVSSVSSSVGNTSKGDISDNGSSSADESDSSDDISSDTSVDNGDTSVDVGDDSSAPDNGDDTSTPDESGNDIPQKPAFVFDLSKIPAYSGSPYIALNNNNPVFSESELTTKGYEYYSPLDSLGRCGVTIASVGKDTMPTAPRGDISSVKPSGWQSVSYNNVDGGSLYNRCHLIGFQLTGENANNKNLITGTRYMNVEGMLPFENMVADYIKETGNHVAYRVTPIFVGNNLVASGVHMEAYSVEDDGDGICFNVYCYNVQPDIEIDYATGNSQQIGGGRVIPEGTTYILNTKNKKFHEIDCNSAPTKNYEYTTLSREELIAQGYISAGCCNP